MSASEDFLQLLIRDGVVSGRGARLTPLTGGVSSDIYRVDDGDDTFVIKRALPRLRVQDEWVVDVSRNRYEHEYLRYIGRILPEAVPAIRLVNDQNGYFAMEYLGDCFANWKQLLLSGEFQVDRARHAGQVLGTIHGRSAGDADAARRFDSTDNFHQLRTDPYLLTTAHRHPQLSPLFRAEAERLDGTRECLVHGDYSPKNILWSDDRMVILDCEVAWYGDPAFDVAFLLNHLYLKSLYHAPHGGRVAEMIRAAWLGYCTSLDDAEFIDRVAHRLVPLLLMLMLARIDGKSPAEYLADAPEKKNFVREFVYRHLESQEEQLRHLPPLPRRAARSGGEDRGEGPREAAKSLFPRPLTDRGLGLSDLTLHWFDGLQRQFG